EVGGRIAAEGVHGHHGDAVAGLAGEVNQLVVQVAFLLGRKELGELEDEVVLVLRLGREAGVRLRMGHCGAEQQQWKQEGVQPVHLPKLTWSSSSFTSPRS